MKETWGSEVPTLAAESEIIVVEGAEGDNERPEDEEEGEGIENDFISDANDYDSGLESECDDDEETVIKKLMQYWLLKWHNNSI